MHPYRPQTNCFFSDFLMIRILYITFVIYSLSKLRNIYGLLQSSIVPNQKYSCICNNYPQTATLILFSYSKCNTLAHISLSSSVPSVTNTCIRIYCMQRHIYILRILFGCMMHTIGYMYWNCFIKLLPLHAYIRNVIW